MILLLFTFGDFLSKGRTTEGNSSALTLALSQRERQSITSLRQFVRRAFQVNPLLGSVFALQGCCIPRDGESICTLRYRRSRTRRAGHGHAVGPQSRGSRSSLSAV